MSKHDITLGGDWAYGPGVLHGGWLVETIATTALQESAHPHPLATSAQFLAAPTAGPATVDVSVLRAGRSVTSLHAVLRQDDVAKVAVSLTAGRLTADAEPYWSRAGAPPALPPVDECVRALPPEGGSRNGIAESMETRYPPGGNWHEGFSTGRGEFAAWMRLADGREPDPLMLLTAGDAMPPITVDLGLRGWVPTIEYTVLVRALPASGWLRAVQRGRLLQDGWLDEDCEIWDSSGRLVAQARQLAGYRAP